jgi:hypothetical protein
MTKTRVLTEEFLQLVLGEDRGQRNLVFGIGDRRGIVDEGKERRGLGTDIASYDHAEQGAIDLLFADMQEKKWELARHHLWVRPTAFQIAGARWLRQLSDRHFDLLLAWFNEVDLDLHSADASVIEIKSQLQVLDDNVAGFFSQLKYADIYLDQVKELSASAAWKLGQGYGRLSMAGLEGISCAAAKGLAPFRGEIELPGICQMSDEAAEVFKKRSGWEPFFRYEFSEWEFQRNGDRGYGGKLIPTRFALEKLPLTAQAILKKPSPNPFIITQAIVEDLVSDPSLVDLSKRSWIEPDAQQALNELQVLSADLAKALRIYGGSELELQGIETMSANAAEQIVGFKGLLYLLGLRHIEKRAADFLASHPGLIIDRHKIAGSGASVLFDYRCDVNRCDVNSIPAGSWIGPGNFWEDGWEPNLPYATARCILCHELSVPVVAITNLSPDYVREDHLVNGWYFAYWGIPGGFLWECRNCRREYNVSETIDWLADGGIRVDKFRFYRVRDSIESPSSRDAEWLRVISENI